ncbi:MAG: GTPase [Thermoprotei archaeon]|nr:MAG: GTPase [Thermoprotei archaeon]
MFTVFVVGPAGSGKSTLVAALYNWLIEHDMDTIIVNLDPAAEWLPYTPDVDVREYVTARKLMEEYNLGPNAAIIAAADYIALNAEEIQREINDLRPGYVLVDTPGQIELFVFRAVGPHIVNTLSAERAAVLFLFDVVFASRPASFVSAMLLSLSCYYRLQRPQLNVLTKIDLVERKVVDEICEWAENVDELYSRIELEHSGFEREISRDVCSLLSKVWSMTRVLPVSAKTGEGIDSLYAVLQQIYVGGEDYVTLP